MLYLHIPFCKQACSYCNFHFSTNLKQREAVIDGLVRELEVRRSELGEGPVSTIYFGGGTPSLLTAAELDRLFGAIRRLGYWSGERATEITLEANPDDLLADKVEALAASPVNRLSIGVQSFDEDDLRLMNRAHDAGEALLAIDRIREAGFDNFSIDLIYGGQTTSDAVWWRNLDLAVDLRVPHVAAYALTVEPRTALGHRVETGAVPDVSDERFGAHFDMLVDRLAGAGYEQYEISNFARPGYRSRHNSGYWTGQAYLGIGPGAHSFDGIARRRWNVSNNARYAKLWSGIDNYADFLHAGPLLFEEESLSERDRYNEFVMTGLRRSEGVSPDQLYKRFGQDAVDHFVGNVSHHLTEGRIVKAPTGYRLTRLGLPMADGIAADAFMMA